ncbi:MAG TPA: DUF1611 domain-containing protein [Armatimonadota bacterium]|jgi:uncharacterized NAD-dependent epimerase/dehydratase family protein
MAGPSYVVLADGAFDVHHAKTACVLLRYKPEQIAAVIDSRYAGSTVSDVVGFGGDVPVVADLQAALRYGPNRLLIGIAPAGGRLPDAWRAVLLDALSAGLDLYNGLHTFLRDDPELAAAALSAGRALVDLRAVPDHLSTPNGSRATVRVPVILTVGTDCNVGKMTVCWEIVRRAAAAGRSYAMAATGQTGRLLTGEGFAIDRVIADYVAGAAERLVCEAAPGKELVLVEGQGSLLHPMYSGVTLGLLHGSLPDAMILCHVAGRQTMRSCDTPICSDLARVRSIYEEAAAWVKPAPVIGIAIATRHLSEGDARAILESTSRETGLPVEDPIRFPSGALYDACEAWRMCTTL